MPSEIVTSLSLAAALVLVAAIVCGAALSAWRGWLSLKRLELERGRRAGPSDAPAEEETDTGTLIELAAVKERLRRLEAIASGVEL